MQSAAGFRAAAVPAAPGRARCSPAWRRTRCCRSRTRRPPGTGSALALSAHAVGWPVARGGSQRVADALVAHLRSLGGEVVVDERVDVARSACRLAPVLCDVTPRQFVAIAGSRLPAGYRRRLERLPLRHGRLQDGLGAERACALARGRLRARRHAAPRRHARRDRAAANERPGTAARPRGRSCWRCSRRASIATRAPAGQHTLVGVLPRAARVDSST